MHIPVGKTSLVSLQKSIASVGAPLRKLIKSSGLYALSSIALPFISLILAPFLTHALSPYDYGVLTILNTVIGLGAGITQLGLGSAFFRAYGYDYTTSGERRVVLGTVLILLCLVSLVTMIGVILLAPLLATILFGGPALGGLIMLAVGVVLLQNLSLPGFAWLRAESRPLFYSLLSIGNVLVTLIATIFLVGILHLGPAGSILATGCGYACVLLCTMPIIVLHTTFKVRADIARSLLAFGLPLVVSFLCSWILQLSDRYLLSLFSSLAETATYAVAYTLGSAISVVVLSPFSLAWPTAIFTIARQENAAQVFKNVFRWYGLFLLFAAFALALAGEILLEQLFPAPYRSGSAVIPVVALSLACYGVSFVVGVGIPLTRRTSLGVICTAVAALVNVALNLVLIPHWGAMGAAIATLIAYAALTLATYTIGKRIYPVQFEIGMFLSALLLGVALYAGNDFLKRGASMYVGWSISFGMLCLYGCCLVLLGLSPIWSRKPGFQQVQEDAV